MRFLAVVLFLFSHVSEAKAICQGDFDKSIIGQAHIIFSGQVVAKKDVKPPSSFSDVQVHLLSESFISIEVTEVLKGNLQKNIDLHFYTNSTDRPRLMSIGKEYLIVLSEPKADKFYIGACSMIIDISDSEELLHVRYKSYFLSKLYQYVARLRVFEKLISKHPKNPWFHVEKAELMSEYGEFDRAEESYLQAINLMHAMSAGSAAIYDIHEAMKKLKSDALNQTEAAE